MIAVQVENEYGSFSKDGSYMEYIKEVRIVFCTWIFVVSS